MRISAIYMFALSLLLLATSAGSAWAAEIILYDHKNFGGRSVTLRGSVPDLDGYNFDNKASAVRVISGTWELFRDDDYQSNHGPSKVLGPGNYPNLSYVGFKRDKLSSVRLISSGDDQTQPYCQGPYRVPTNDGRCVWSCSQGTKPGPSGECECRRGLVETARDIYGRRVCTAQPPYCAGPYHVPTSEGHCVWSCSQGTQPGPSGECECRPGLVETAQDIYGRRVCTAQPSYCQGPYHVLTNDGRCVWSCSQGTQPAPNGECERRPGLVEAGQDNHGRCVCTAPPQTPPAPQGDCISFDWRNVQARNVNGRWKLTAGNMLMLDFGDNRAEAIRARSIVQHYRMSEQCFVGRPNPSMRYWLVNGQAPSGGVQSEDCVPFNPALTEVRRVQGRWKIVEGSHWIMDFGANRAEAEQSLAILGAYGFDRTCFVGRPNPSMTYFRW